MRYLSLATSACALLLAAWTAAAAPPNYQMTPLASPPDGSLEATAMNNRGEVIGWYTHDGIQHGFIWRNGQFTTLNERFNPAVLYMEPQGLNNRSQITGNFSNWETGRFSGFLLDGDHLRIIDGPPGAQYVWVSGINDHGTMFGTSYDADGNESSWVLKDGTYTVLDPNFIPVRMNKRGVIVGQLFVPPFFTYAAYWKNGEIVTVEPSHTFGTGLNDRGLMTGTHLGNGAFVWGPGYLEYLPPLRQYAFSVTGSPNNAGDIVGTTEYTEYVTINRATLWTEGSVYDINSLIDPADPLREYVTLQHASHINKRGDILARGTDSRSAGLVYYFLKPVQEAAE